MGESRRGNGHAGNHRAIDLKTTKLIQAMICGAQEETEVTSPERDDRGHYIVILVPPPHEP
jgi:hypothetical protein